MIYERGLVNGFIFAEDIDTDSIISYTINGKTASILTGTSISVEGKYGTLELKSDGSYTYQATGKDYEVEIFEYKLTTALGSTSISTLSINVSKFFNGTENSDILYSSSADDVITRACPHLKNWF